MSEETFDRLNISIRLMVEGMEAFTAACNEAAAALRRFGHAFYLREKRMRLTVAKTLRSWGIPVPLALWISRKVPARWLTNIAGVMEA